MKGMTFDAGTWWLIGILISLLLGVIAYLMVRSIFKQLDENKTDIKEVRESYTTRSQHAADLKEIRGEMKDLRGEVRGDIQKLNENIDRLRETMVPKDDFLRNMNQLGAKIDRLQEMFMERGGKV